MLFYFSFTILIRWYINILNLPKSVSVTSIPMFFPPVNTYFTYKMLLKGPCAGVAGAANNRITVKSTENPYKVLHYFETH